MQAAYGSGVAHGARPSQGNGVGFSSVSFQVSFRRGPGWFRARLSEALVVVIVAFSSH